MSNKKNHTIKKVGLAVRTKNIAACKLAIEVADFCKINNVSVCGLKELTEVKQLKLDEYFSESELVSNVDLIVTLGGDGTLLSVGRHSSSNKSKTEGPLLLGVNFGTLGFLTEIAPDECLHYLKKAFLGEVTLGTRTLLKATVIRGDKEIFSGQSLNDAIIQKGTKDRMLDLDIVVSNEPVLRLRGDGLIVATPTGSTAYSLAAGGAIVHPDLSVLLLTPICAHSLSTYPLILPDTSTISVSIPDYDGEVFLSLDGQEWCSLEPWDVVSITKSKNTLNFIHSTGKSYFEILRTKLRWGIGNAIGG